LITTNVRAYPRVFGVRGNIMSIQLEFPSPKPPGYGWARLIAETANIAEWLRTTAEWLSNLSETEMVFDISPTVQVGAHQLNVTRWGENMHDICGVARRDDGSFQSRTLVEDLPGAFEVLTAMHQYSGDYLAQSPGE